MNDTFRDEVEQFDGEYPPTVQPEVGQTIVGKIVGFSSGRAGAYGTKPIALIETEDPVTVYRSGSRVGENVPAGTVVSLWLMHFVLLSQWKKEKPAIGERVAVRRLPDVQRSGENPYRNFMVRVDRKAGTLDLTDYLPEPDPLTTVDPELGDLSF